MDAQIYKMSSIIVKKYCSEDKEKRDAFISKSKNGHFFFSRDYLEYHSDRFADVSLIVHDDTGKAIALLRANIKDSVIYSHQGLTFGGFIIDAKMRTEVMLEIFSH